jgi:flagellar biosynthesis/type III secretory pathway protein FliH
MLKQRVEQWNAEILERGRRLGHEEGRKEGRQERYQEEYRKGYQEAYQEGRREEVIIFIRCLAQRRFGALSSEMAQQMAAMPREKGEALVEAFLDFSSVADFEDWLRGSGFFADQNGPIEMASEG